MVLKLNTHITRGLLKTLTFDLYSASRASISDFEDKLFGGGVLFMAETFCAVDDFFALLLEEQTGKKGF